MNMRGTECIQNKNTKKGRWANEELVTDYNKHHRKKKDNHEKNEEQMSEEIVLLK
jgi:hypothetical protein